MGVRNEVFGSLTENEKVHEAIGAFDAVQTLQRMNGTQVRTNQDGSTVIILPTESNGVIEKGKSEKQKIQEKEVERHSEFFSHRLYLMTQAITEGKFDSKRVRNFEVENLLAVVDEKNNVESIKRIYSDMEAKGGISKGLQEMRIKILNKIAPLFELQDSEYMEMFNRLFSLEQPVRRDDRDQAWYFTLESFEYKTPGVAVLFRRDEISSKLAYKKDLILANGDYVVRTLKEKGIPISVQGIRDFLNQ